MKIALIGYGQMGQMIEKIALRRGHHIVARITADRWDMKALQQADLCMEFTHPQGVLANVRKVAEERKDIVIGTTGWQDSIKEVQSIVEKSSIGGLYSANFSIGVHLLLKILTNTSKLMSEFEDYDVAAVEYHHNRKKDRPSGTALEIAKTIEEHLKRIDQLPFSSVRCGSIPGTHTVLFDSPCDTISISHTARNREGFATGAVIAAEWLLGKKGLFTFDHCMTEIIERRSR
jgi:4-hydroxy-tetrahydrodipicolinate reductase